ncbi:MAG: hypothetical protein AB8C95_15360 [Phycisphaeraceae bacterium]
MAERIDYLFSINTGRSGSNYLGQILEHVVGCRAMHEPAPIGNGEVMRRYLRGEAMPMKEFARKKLEAIKQLKKGSQVYAETNHCFIKGFGWFVPEHLPAEKIGVVILKREPKKIAQSLLRIGCTPLVAGGREWIKTPEIESPLVEPPKRMGSRRLAYHAARLIKLPLRALDFMVDRCLGSRLGYPSWLTEYELECLEWYVQETYARAELFKKTHPNIRYYEVSIDELNSLESVEAMLKHFGLAAKPSLKDLVGKPTNLKAA